MEQVVDKSFGFVSSLFIWAIILVPVMGYESTVAKNIWVTLIFTVWSIIRGYGTRRLFNYLHERGWFK